MNNLRIIAIKTGKPFDPTLKNGKKKQILDPLKVLQPHTVYSFYTHYTFPKKDFSDITYNDEKDIPIYNITNSAIKLPININAIVGQNGSGKSTLIELLYWANYNIGSKLGLFDENSKRKRPIPFSFLDIEILYSIGNVFYRLIFKNANIFKQEARLRTGIVKYTTQAKEITSTSDLKDFFYTVVVNYSHYSLNSLEIGDWINDLFHKNDGYQTPIVLNPMRIRGIIDINDERRLLYRRLQANLLEYVKPGEEENSLRNLVNGKIAKELTLEYNSSFEPNLQQPITHPSFEKLIEALKEHFGLIITQKLRDDNFFVNVALNYIYGKMVKIAHTYKPYFRYREKGTGTYVKDVNAFVKRLKGSNSHITFKVKGAIVYIKYFEQIFEGKFSKDKRFDLNIQHLSELTLKIRNEEKNRFWVNTFMMAPPSFFLVYIVTIKDSPLEALSSGEKQRLHSISSIIYHLINLNSVEQLRAETDSYVHYNYINIVLDEIELYYHPDWQRRYVSDLLTYISKVSPDNLQYIKGLNITFLTHSPFILSDIPHTNVLYLSSEGKSLNEGVHDQTFGANIHDLLQHNFFLENGSMGEYAQGKINDAIYFLNSIQLKREIGTMTKLNSGDKNKLDENEKRILDLKTEELKAIKKLVKAKNHILHKKMIDLVAEPLLSHKLNELYEELFPKQQTLVSVQKKIAELKTVEARLKSN